MTAPTKTKHQVLREQFRPVLSKLIPWRVLVNEVETIHDGMSYRVPAGRRRPLNRLDDLIAYSVTSGQVGTPEDWPKRKPLLRSALLAALDDVASLHELTVETGLDYWILTAPYVSY